MAFAINCERPIKGNNRNGFDTSKYGGNKQGGIPVVIKRHYNEFLLYLKMNTFVC